MGIQKEKGRLMKEMIQSLKRKLKPRTFWFGGDTHSKDGFPATKLIGYPKDIRFRIGKGICPQIVILVHQSDLADNSSWRFTRKTNYVYVGRDKEGNLNVQ